MALKSPSGLNSLNGQTEGLQVDDDGGERRAKSALHVYLSFYLSIYRPGR